MKEKKGFLDSIPMVIGLAFLAMGTLFIITESIGNSVNRTARAAGTVVEIESKDFGEDFTILATVGFVTQDGRSIVSTLNTHQGGLIYWMEWKDRIGQPITVRYDPADPTNARIDSGSGIDSDSWWFVPAIFIVVGGWITLSGIRQRGKSKGAPKLDTNRNG